MTTEQKQLVEDAARLLGLEVVDWRGSTPVATDNQGLLSGFNPYDPERGDLMKVARAGWITIRHENGTIDAPIFNSSGFFKHLYNDYFDTDDYQSLALAILRAASAVYRARNENDLLP